MRTNTEILHFKFDVSTFRLLGRELITDRITALFELVKNCYDANADNVTITFENVNPLSDKSRIIIEDDGLGMTSKDIRDKWMVVGTSSKRRRTTSPAPYNRVVVGKKGVGRFAVDKLGSKMVLRTKKKGSDQWQCLETDWQAYSAEEAKQLTIDFDNINQEPKLFTEMDNSFWTEIGPSERQGTILEISALNDVWTEKDIIRAYKELAKIVRPSREIKYPFNLCINAPQYNGFHHKKVESMALAQATLSYSIGFRYDEEEKKYFQEYLDEENGIITKKEQLANSFGPISFTVYYYDKEAKRKVSKDGQLDGIKIYRDGLIATPFAEYQANRDSQKDLLGIDKRRWSGFFEKLSTRDIIGWIDITDELNPNIKDSTNRQDFVDNKEWGDLKEFVINQIHQIELYLKHQREQKRLYNSQKLKEADSEIDKLANRIQRIKTNVQFSSPDFDKDIEDIIAKIESLKQTVSESSKEYEKIEEDARQQENILFSLVSLQAYAGQISHIIRTSIGAIKRSAEFVAKWEEIGEKRELCIKHAKNVYNEMESLSKAMDFMLSYAQDDSTFEPFDVKETVNDIFDNYYARLFEEENVKTEIVCEEQFDLVYNRKAFIDMFGNLIDNSIKAMRNQKGKKIKCSVSKENELLTIMFSDNGVGIPTEKWERVFDVFYTTTADLGGAGLGLYIIRTRLEAINGTIKVEQPEFLPQGATLKIVIPLKQL